MCASSKSGRRCLILCVALRIMTIIRIRLECRTWTNQSRRHSSASIQTRPKFHFKAGAEWSKASKAETPSGTFIREYIWRSNSDFSGLWDASFLQFLITFLTSRSKHVYSVVPCAVLVRLACISTGSGFTVAHSYLGWVRIEGWQMGAHIQQNTWVCQPSFNSFFRKSWIELIFLRCWFVLEIRHLLSMGDIAEKKSESQ